MPLSPQITKQTQILLEQAATLRVAGLEWTEVAATMKRSYNTITKYPGAYPAEWAEATDRARTERLGELWDKAARQANRLLDSDAELIVAKAVQSTFSHVAAMRPQKLDVDLVVRTATEGLEEVLQQVGIPDEQIDAVLEGMGKRLGG